jgi:hypothetical protein
MWRHTVSLLILLLATLPLELRNSSEINSHSRILSYSLGTDHAQKTQFYCCVEQTTQKTRVTCQTASSLVRYQHWTWRGRHRKHSLVYCCVLDRVYRAVAWQRVDGIRYNITSNLWKPAAMDSDGKAARDMQNSKRHSTWGGSPFFMEPCSSKDAILNHKHSVHMILSKDTFHIFTSRFVKLSLS